MSSFSAFLAALPDADPARRSYALAVPEASLRAAAGDRPQLDDLVLYGLDMSDEAFAVRRAGAREASGDPQLPLLTSPLCYLASAARQAGHAVVELSLPDWSALTGEALAFLCLASRSVLAGGGGIGLAVADDGGGRVLVQRWTTYAGGLCGEVAAERIGAARTYPALNPGLNPGRASMVRLGQGHVDALDRIFVAEPLRAVVRRWPQPLADETAMMRQLLSYLSHAWDRGNAGRGHNVAAALAVPTSGDDGLRPVLFVPNASARCRAAHAELRILCLLAALDAGSSGDGGPWPAESAIARRVAALSGLSAAEVAKIVGDPDLSQPELLMLTTLAPPCLGATAVCAGLPVPPAGPRRRRLAGCVHFDGLAELAEAMPASGPGSEGAIVLTSLAAPTLLTAEGRAIHGPVTVRHARDDFASENARDRLHNSAFDASEAGGALRLTPCAGVDYGFGGEFGPAGQNASAERIWPALSRRPEFQGLLRSLDSGFEGEEC
ncbi:hypothetical protein [Polymorphum gilvum]|uniref:Uncharacterized protein n=1 Tax=Polymorphum gilvum (strain LMG 25793 / CGMCC 1.9160 / SL003B-26A1) TaxID=991905 RepID=F2J2F7_POLGS|nr:hypothetical protein [Polymorphum gilvum]ADZ69853.1 hypothetical protein SL003B_1425 [Polymorphum gilvum SL003B-26A1]